MDTITIRNARPDDLPAILIIEKDSFVSPWSEDTFNSVFSDPRCKGFVACEADVLAGYCFAFEMRNMIHLLSLAVRSEHRRKGIGRALLEEIEILSRQSDRQGVILEVRVGNQVAKSFYNAMGYTDVCTWKEYYTDTLEDALVMAKRIE
jgi:ribosomal-protein-alanine N-acetyltransferase